MVRKQNERTILLHSRIIQLSLPTNSILSYFSTPCPLSTRLGAFSFPETFSRKFFPKFFPILPRRLFSGFLVRKIMGAKGTCRSPNGGGVPFRMLTTQQRSPYFIQHLRVPLHLQPWQISIQSGAKKVQNRSKVKICLLVFVYPS